VLVLSKKNHQFVLVFDRSRKMAYKAAYKACKAAGYLS